MTAADVTATAKKQMVPNLEGPPYVRYNDGAQLALNQGFQVSIVGFQERPNVPAGVIVDQCPKGGQPRDIDTSHCRPGFAPPAAGTILVVVSSLPEPEVMLLVPDIYGQPEDEARQILENGDLRIGTRYEAYDLLMPPGHVVEQNPRRGLAVLPGTFVDIIISAGLPPSLEDGLSVEPSTQSNPTITPSAVSTPIPTIANNNNNNNDGNNNNNNNSSNNNNSNSNNNLTQQPYPAPGGLATQPVVTQFPTQVPTVPPPPSFTPLPSPTLTAIPTETPFPLPQATATELVNQTEVLSDNFDQGNSLGWIENENTLIQDGVLSIKINEPRQFRKIQPGQLLADYVYRATVTLDEASFDDPEASAGLLFRIQDEQHFYFFEVNGLGGFRLRARDDDEWKEVIPWTPEPAINIAGKPNVLEVRLKGETLKLFINEQEIAAQIDVPKEQNYTSGDIGLGAQTGELPLTVQFDDVFVNLAVE